MSQEEGTACVGEEIREAKYHRSPKELGVLGEGECERQGGNRRHTQTTEGIGGLSQGNE